MNVRILVLSLCLLGTACAGPQAPPTPAPPTAASAPAAASPPAAPGSPVAVGSPTSSPARTANAPSEAPHRLHRVAEMWAFRPDGVAYEYWGCIEVLKPGQEAIAFGNTPIWKGDHATTARWAGDMELVMLDPIPYPGNDAYQVLMHVIKPKVPARVGDRLRARYHLEFKDVPYLHRNQGNHRLLSLTLQPEAGVSRHNLLFAIPENASPVVPTDMKPIQVITVPGWRVYRYEISKAVQAVVHLAFELTPPSKPLPPLEELLPPAEAVTCP